MRRFPVMKRTSLILFGLLIMTAIAAWLIMMPSGLEPKAESHQFLKEAPAVPDPLISSLPAEIDSVEVVEESLSPVQTLEERGDALLFEIDALQAMPFDQAIVSPFE